MALWLISGGTVTASGRLPPVASSWPIDNVDDFNGDGEADILWRDTSGALGLWLMNGLAVAGTSGLGTVTIDWVTR